MIQKSVSIYIGHVTPPSGSPVSITKALANCLEVDNIYTDYLNIIEYDGTVTNTGFKNDIISGMEHYLGRTVQWIICLLHGNVLPFTI